MANPYLGVLTDSFTSPTINTTLWNATSGSGVTLAAPGRVAVQATASYPTLGAAGPFEATGQSLAARITPALGGTGGAVVQTLLKIQKDANNSAYFVCQPGTLWQAVIQNAGVNTTVNLTSFDPTAHAWWKLTESASQWLFSVSADGFAWTQLAAISYSWSPHAVSAYFIAGSSTVTGQTAYIEHVNTAAGPSPLMPSWPQLRFQVAFNTGGTSAVPPAFVDLSSRLRGSWSATPAGRQYELDQVQSGQMSCSLWNLDGALDPLNTASPYYPNVLPLRQARLQAVWPPTRNLLPQTISSGLNSTTATVRATAGNPTWATSLAPAPTGHTTAHAWFLSASTASGAVLALTAGGNAFTAPDASCVPVVAGQQYTTTYWAALHSGGDTTLTVTPTIYWYSVTGTLLSTNTGIATTVTVVGTWTQQTLTATAPAGAVCARTAIQTGSVPSTNTTVYLTAWQLEQASAATPWTAGGVISPLWAGYVERWPQIWKQQGTYGLVNLTCVDVLAGLSQFEIVNQLVGSLHLGSPTMLYPLDEPNGSTSFADVTAQRGALVATTAPAGGTGASITAGQSVQGTGSAGNAGPVVTISNPSPGLNTPSQAMYLSAPATGPWGPPTSGAWGRMIAFRTTVTPSTFSYIWLASGPGEFGIGPGSQGVALLYIDSSGYINGYVSNAAGTAAANVTVTGINVTDGNWHVATLQLAADGSQMTVGCDGTTFPSGTYATDLHPTGITSDIIGCEIANGSAYYTFSGDIAYAVEFPNDYSADTRAITTAWSGDTSIQRATRILTLAGLPLNINDAGTNTTMGGANLTGTDTMSALGTVADTEGGQVYPDGSGALWLAGRKARFLQSTATITFGENAPTEIPYLGDITIDFDPTHVYNSVTVTNQGAVNSTTPPPVIVNNAASQAAFLPRTLNRTINAQDQTLPAAAAQYLAQQYAQPQGRPSTVTIDGAANPAVWASILGLGFGTRAQLNRRPPTGPGAALITIQAFIEHLDWSGDDQGKFQLALQLTSAAPYIGWGVVAAMHTALAAPVSSGSTTITVNALNGSASNPASAALPVGTLVYVGYGTAVQELNQVTAVAATSPGYSTVVLTLTAALGYSHVAGETVCEALHDALPAAVLAGYPASLDAPATLTANGPRAAY